MSYDYEMERYDYAKAVRNDCVEVVKEVISFDEFSKFGIEVSDYSNADEFKNAVAEKMIDHLTGTDNVTGANSNSYYCDAYKVEESLCHNLDLLVEACDNLGLDVGEEIRNPEMADVIIRQYEVRQEIENVIEDVADELEQYFNEKTEEISVDKD